MREREKEEDLRQEARQETLDREYRFTAGNEGHYGRRGYRQDCRRYPQSCRPREHAAPAVESPIKGNRGRHTEYAERNTARYFDFIDKTAFDGIGGIENRNPNGDIERGTSKAGTDAGAYPLLDNEIQGHRPDRSRQSEAFDRRLRERGLPLRR
jgi:hypothetical protein